MRTAARRPRRESVGRGRGLPEAGYAMARGPGVCARGHMGRNKEDLSLARSLACYLPLTHTHGGSAVTVCVSRRLSALCLTVFPYASVYVLSVYVSHSVSVAESVAVPVLRSVERWIYACVRARALCLVVQRCHGQPHPPLPLLHRPRLPFPHPVVRWNVEALWRRVDLWRGTAV